MKEKLKLKVSPIPFWVEYLKVMNQHSVLFKNVRPSERRYISARTGISGVDWSQTIGESSVTTEIYIHHIKKERNKFVFDELIKNKEQIENQFGEIIDWARLDAKDACRIKRPKLENVNCLNEDDWNRMIDFMVDGMLRMEKAFKEPLEKIKLGLKIVKSSD